MLTSHELAKQLLEMDDLPVRLYTDHGQTLQMADGITIRYTTKETSTEYSIDYCYVSDEDSEINDTDEIVSFIEIS